MAEPLFFIMITALCTTVSPYVLYHEPKSWFEAQTYCRDTNSDLATVVTLTNNNLIQSVTAESSYNYAWIGLFDDTTKWKWSLGNVDHNGSHFSNWDSFNPDYYPDESETRICVRMLTNGLWDDTNCFYAIPKVCHNDLSGYTFLNTPNTWSDSQSYCRANHKDLPSVQDINENALIENEITKNAWIGLYRHTWTNWSDGTFSTFSNWDEISMDFYLNTSAKFHCAMVNTQSGMWFRASCNTKIPFICNGEAVGQVFSSGTAGTSETVQMGHISRIKIRLNTDGNPNNAAIQHQILQQLHTKMEEHGLSDFKLRWTQMQKESIDKEEEAI